MNEPWSIPPEPFEGDHSPKYTHAAVGLALSEWEDLELDLAVLYSVFLGISSLQAFVSPAYADARIFAVRANVIEAEAERYFVKHPCQEREGEFWGLICDARKFGDRRNDIAHGVVRKIFWEGEPFWGDEPKKPEYWLVPGIYRHTKFVDSDHPRQPREPRYRLAAKDIRRFAVSFLAFRRRIWALILRLDPARAPLPDRLKPRGRDSSSGQARLPREAR